MGQSSAIVSTVANPNLSWSLQPGVLIGVALVGGAYLMRWRRVRASTSRVPAPTRPCGGCAASRARCSWR